MSERARVVCEQIVNEEISCKGVLRLFSILKDFELKDIANVDSFEERAVTYSKVKHSNLMELQALFYDKVRD